MTYQNKIIKHQKLNSEDLKEFCEEEKNKLQIGDYIKSLELTNYPYNIDALYSKKEQLIYLTSKPENLYKIFRNAFINSDLLNIILHNNDIYNLFFIEVLYHEMWHAKQVKEANNNTSIYGELVKASTILAENHYETYQTRHNSYFHEYDAIINSIFLTLNFAKEYNFSPKVINLMNRYYASEIISSYGIKSIETMEEHISPILFTKTEVLKYKEEIENYKKVLETIEKIKPKNNDYFNLLRGHDISNYYCEILFLILANFIKTENIFNTLFDSYEKLEKLKLTLKK